MSFPITSDHGRLMTDVERIMEKFVASNQARDEDNVDSIEREVPTPNIDNRRAIDLTYEPSYQKFAIIIKSTGGGYTSTVGDAETQLVTANRIGYQPILVVPEFYYNRNSRGQNSDEKAANLSEIVESIGAAVILCRPNYPKPRVEFHKYSNFENTKISHFRDFLEEEGLATEMHE